MTNEIPCGSNEGLRSKICAYADHLKEQAHTIGDHGMTSDEFYKSGLFRGAIERIRGQFSATMREKREFASLVLNRLRDSGFIRGWESSGGENRYDYSVDLNSGRIAAIELKGCLDGNNTNIFERPSHAHEFIMWSVCTNPGADPRKNVWSGIHTRLSAEIISKGQVVDGLVVWDMYCGSSRCPKLMDRPDRASVLGQYQLPPPCVYLFPGTLPSPRNNPSPPAQSLNDVEILNAFHECFGGRASEVSSVSFEVENRGADLARKTTIHRGGEVCRESNFTPIRRS